MREHRQEPTFYDAVPQDGRWRGAPALSIAALWTVVGFGFGLLAAAVALYLCLPTATVAELERIGQRLRVRVVRVGDLPATCRPGTFWLVEDGSDSADCDLGAGNSVHFCVCTDDGLDMVAAHHAAPVVELARRRSINNGLLIVTDAGHSRDPLNWGGGHRAGLVFCDGEECRWLLDLPDWRWMLRRTIGPAS